MSDSIDQAVIEFPLYVANKAIKSGQWLEVHDKFSGKIYAKVALADAKILEKAISAAVKAEKEMAALKPFQKQKYCYIVSSALKSFVKN